MARGFPVLDFLTDNTTGDGAAYASGDQVGGASSSALQWTGAGGFGGAGIIIRTIVTLFATTNAELDLLIYNDTFTAGTNNSAFAEHANDVAKCAGIINIPSTAFKLVGTDRYRADIESPRIYRCAGGEGGTLYGNLIARGALDLVTTFTIYVSLGVERAS